MNVVSFAGRSNLRESTESQSRLSGKISEERPATGEPRLRSGGLEQDDLFSTIEPNDILDLPRVRLKMNHDE